MVLYYVWALALIALLLWLMTLAVRAFNRGRLVAGTDRRLVTVVESTVLAQNTAVHVVKIAGAYVLVGGGPSGVTHIADVPADVVEPYIEAQRKALGDQRDQVLAFIKRFRK